MSDAVIRLPGDPRLDFRAINNGDGTYSLAVAVQGGGGGVSYITDVSDTASVTLSVDDGTLTATVIGLDAKADASALAAHIGDTAAHTNTTYGAMSAAEAQTGTATTARTISAKVLADEIDRRVAEAIAGITIE